MTSHERERRREARAIVVSHLAAAALVILLGALVSFVVSRLALAGVP